MKKLMVMMIVGLLAINVVQKPAQADSALDIIKGYGIPCALAVGISGAFVKNDGFIIGGAICAGIASATLLSKKPAVDENMVKEKVDAAVAERDMKLSEDIDQKLAKSEEQQKDLTEETRKIMREILADRLVRMDEDIRSDLEKKMQSGEFFPSLEKKITAKIKEEVILEGRARNREFLNQVVDEVIRQVVAKPVAVPDNSAGQ